MPAYPGHASKQKALFTPISFACNKSILCYPFQSYFKTTRKKEKIVPYACHESNTHFWILIVEYLWPAFCYIGHIESIWFCTWQMWITHIFLELSFLMNLVWESCLNSFEFFTICSRSTKVKCWSIFFINCDLLYKTDSNGFNFVVNFILLFSERFLLYCLNLLTFLHWN